MDESLEDAWGRLNQAGRVRALEILREYLAKKEAGLSPQFPCHLGDLSNDKVPLEQDRCVAMGHPSLQANTPGS